MVRLRARRRAVPWVLAGLGLVVVVLALIDPVGHLLADDDKPSTPAERQQPDQAAAKPHVDDTTIDTDPMIIALEIILLACVAACVATPILLGRRRRRKRAASPPPDPADASAGLGLGVNAHDQVRAGASDP